MKDRSIRSTATLPEGYTELARIDLKENKKLFVLVNLLSLVIGAAVFAVGLLFVPLSAVATQDMGLYFLRLGSLIGGIFLYVLLHEAVHGVFMKAFTGVKPHYGFTSVYAYAGSTAYFCRRHYITVALAPIVLWGVVLAILCPLVPREWFWILYFIQVTNISGAAGDLYVTVRMLRMPADILVQDSGVAMTVYSRAASEPPM